MLKAIIFDFDGVIAHTEPIHLQAFQIVLEEERISLSEEQYYERYLAYDDKTFFKKLLEDRAVNHSDDYISRLVTRKSLHYNRLITGNVELFPGVLELISEVRGRVRLAIGSGALRQEIEHILNFAGIRKDFEFIVGAEDVEKCKPAPDVYLEVHRRLNVQSLPEDVVLLKECLVIEDSISGVRAARSAGMKCIAVTNSYPMERLSEANLVIESLDGIKLHDLIQV